MATDEPRDGEDYFEALAGRRPGGPGTDALRDALQAQLRTLREADEARAANLSADEQARMAALKERLRAAGAFRPAPVTPAAPRWGERLRTLLLGDSWQRPFAIAAGVLLASVLALRLAGPGDDDDPSRALRGKPPAVVTAADPAAAAQALEAQLVAAGAEVLRVQVNAAEWSLEVKVSEAGRVAAVQQVLRAAGVAVEGPPPYELTVRSAK